VCVGVCVCVCVCVNVITPEPSEMSLSNWQQNMVRSLHDLKMAAFRRTADALHVVSLTFYLRTVVGSTLVNRYLL